MTKYKRSEPSDELCGSAVTVLTPSLASWALKVVVGWPGMTVVNCLPLARVPVTVVFEPALLLPNVTSLIL